MNARLLTAAATAGMAALLLSGCSGAAAAEVAATPTATSTAVCTAANATANAATVLSKNSATHESASDTVYDNAAVTNIALSGTGTTITAAGTYRLSGTISNGSVVVNSTGNGVVRLLLNGVSIANAKGAAIEIKAAAKVVIVLVAGTTNTLSDASTYASTATAAAALHSKASVTIAGTGKLVVKGNGADGIVSTDGLVISSGVITVTAKDEGIRGKDYLVIRGGTVNVTATGDGLRADGKKSSTVGYVVLAGGSVTVHAKSDAVQGSSDVVISGGTVTLTASDDAINAGCVALIERAKVVVSAGDDGVHSDAEAVVNSGTLTVKASYEGLEGGNVTVRGGTIALTSSDDCVNVVGGADASGMQRPGQAAAATTASNDAFSANIDYFFTMSAGTLVVNAKGDGIDIGGAMTVSGGKIVVSGPTENNNGALDVDGEFLVSGGSILAVGSAGMAVAPSTSSKQASIMASFGSAVAAGTIVHVAKADGTVLASFKSPKAFASVVFTSPKIVKGTAYKIYTGGSVSGTSTGGWYAKGGLAKATLAGTVTAGSYTNAGPGGGRGPRP